MRSIAEMIGSGFTIGRNEMMDATPEQNFIRCGQDKEKSRMTSELTRFQPSMTIDGGAADARNHWRTDRFSAADAPCAGEHIQFRGWPYCLALWMFCSEQWIAVTWPGRNLTVAPFAPGLLFDALTRRPAPEG